MRDVDLDAIRERLPDWLAWASGRAPIPGDITRESPEGQIITMLATALEAESDAQVDADAATFRVNMLAGQLAEKEQRIAVLDHLEAEARNTCFRWDEKYGRLRAAAQAAVELFPEGDLPVIDALAAALENRDE